METTLISQVAQQVLYKGSKLPESLQTGKDQAIATDRLEISPEVGKKIQENTGKSEFDLDREMKVERVRQLIMNRDYPGKEDIIGKIADKIITNLL